MGLKFTDHGSWAAWQASRRRLHVLKDRLTGKGGSGSPVTFEFLVRGSEPKLLVACDSNSPTNHHSLLTPLGDALDAVIVKPTTVNLELPAGRGARCRRQRPCRRRWKPWRRSVITCQQGPGPISSPGSVAGSNGWCNMDS